MMRYNRVFTPTAGSPINLSTGTTTAPSASSSPDYVRSIRVQSQHGGTGIVTVLDGVYPFGRVPVLPVDCGWENSVPTATAPGVGPYIDQDDTDGGGIDLRAIWIAVTVTSDPVFVSFDRV